MGLGEAVVGEGEQLAVDRVGVLPDDAVVRHSLEQRVGELEHLLGGALGAHRPAQLIGLGGAEVGDVDHHLHQLLLEQRDPEGALQRLLQPRVEEGDLLLAGAAPDVGVHGAALDGAGPDQRHLDHQVVEHPGSQARKGGDLGAGFHLEHAHAVPLAQHVVDRCVLLRQGAQLEVLAVVLGDDPQCMVERGEHPQTQQVELHQAGVGAVLLVPLQHGAVLHRGPLHRAHLDHRPVREHHPAGVDAQVPRGVAQLVGELDDVGGDVGVGERGEGALDPLGEGVLRAGVVAECPGGVAHRESGPVGDDVGDLGGILPAVAVVDVLDHLLPAIGGDVDVDVRRAVPLRCQEAFEQQVVADGFDRGDPQRVADRAVGGGAPALGEDPLVCAEVDDLVDDEEIAGEVQIDDDLQLMVDLRPRPRDLLGTLRRRAWSVALAPLDLHQLHQPARLVVPGRDREGRQVRGQQPQVQGAVPAQPRRLRDRAGIAGQQLGHLLAAAQVRGAGGEVGIGLGERHPGTQGGVGVRQALVRRAGVVGVGARHQRQGDLVQPVALAHQARALGEGVMQLVRLSPTAGDQLDGDIAGPEQLHQTGDRLGGGVGGRLEVPGLQVRCRGAGHRALPAAGEDLPMPLAGEPGELGEPVARGGLLPAVEVGVGDRGRELPVAVRVAHQHQQMLPFRVRDAGP